MSIDTERDYNPRLDHPLYVKIIPDNHNDYTPFQEYEIRIPDEDRGEEGPYNYAFEALLVGKEIVEWQELPALLLAYTAKERKADKALAKVHPLGEDGSFEEDDELAVLFFLRMDETKKYITSEHDVLLAQDADIQ